MLFLPIIFQHIIWCFFNKKKDSQKTGTDGRWWCLFQLLRVAARARARDTDTDGSGRTRHSDQTINEGS